MKLSLSTTAFAALALGPATASRLRTIDDRNAALLRRSPGKHRITDTLQQPHDVHRRLQEYTTISGHSCFRDLAGMTSAMFDLEQNYPNLVTVSDIGDSYLKTVDQGGYDINVMKITASTSSNPAQVFFTGGHHSRELAPPELLMRFAELLVTSYDVDSDITWILNTTEIHIVLYVNPDGRYIAENEQDLFWRKNANPNDVTCPSDSFGTDLNRNYDWMWCDTSGASDNPCDEDYCGQGAGSEPEVQAIVEYAESIFPVGQRKDDPVGEMEVPFGEDVMGVYLDCHSYGGLTYYPWGFENKVSPDNDSLEALGRKISFFNGYVLWAGGQPDFLYPATGDASDYMYAHLGVASMGLEIGTDFYQDCDTFEKTVYPDNLNSLLYVIKLAKKPNSLSKGPDIFDLTVTASDGEIIVSVDASDSELVNIDGYPSFTTGEQTVTKIELYLDVLPEEYGDDDTKYILQPMQVANSDRVSVETEISTTGLSNGRHVLYAVATDSDGYAGPISSVFFEVENIATPSPIASTPTPSIAAETTTTTFTTTTTEDLTDPPSNEPVSVTETDAPVASESTSAPSVATGTEEPSSASPTIGKVSSSPTVASISLFSSQPSPALTSGDTSEVSPTPTVGSTTATSSPSVESGTVAPSTGTVDVDTASTTSAPASDLEATPTVIPTSSTSSPSVESGTAAPVTGKNSPSVVVDIASIASGPASDVATLSPSSIDDASVTSSPIDESPACRVSLHMALLPVLFWFGFV